VPGLGRSIAIGLAPATAVSSTVAMGKAIGFGKMMKISESNQKVM
jgi:hypothetical protein